MRKAVGAGRPQLAAMSESASGRLARATVSMIATARRAAAEELADSVMGGDCEPGTWHQYKSSSRHREAKFAENEKKVFV
jgi:hypothetical protein